MEEIEIEKRFYTHFFHDIKSTFFNFNEIWNIL